MIGKGNHHSGGVKLARYLMEGQEGERAELLDVRGFGTVTDLCAAFRHEQIKAREGTHGEKPFFHVQFRAAHGEGLHKLSLDDWKDIADRCDKALNRFMSDQPRVASMHIDLETGDRHMHLAYSLVKEREDGSLYILKVGLYKKKLKELSRQLEKDYGLQIVSNERKEGDKAPAPNRTELEESRRLKTDIKQIRSTILDCFEKSDNGQAFQAALAEQGLILSNGTKRDCFVVIDQEGGHHALNKKLTGMTLAQTRERLADLDCSQLPSVEQAQELQRAARAVQTERDFTAASAKTTEPPVPNFDREAAEREWNEQLVSAAIAYNENPQRARKAGEHWRGAAAARGPYAELLTPEPEQEQKAGRPLTRTQAEMRAALNLSHSAQELEDALAAHTISLAAVTPEEARRSERIAAFAKEVGNFARSWREGEIVAVNGRGDVYRFDERVTGEKQFDLQARYPRIDRRTLMSMTDAQEAMREAGNAQWRADRQAEREAARPANFIEHTVNEALQSTMTGIAFAEQLEKKGITIAQATARDMGALEALRESNRLNLNSGLDAFQRLAELLPGDYAALNRQGEVFRLSPQKIDLVEVEQRLGDVQTRLPSITEARAYIEQENTRRADERIKEGEEYIAARLEQADAFAGKLELKRVVGSAERMVHKTFEGARDAAGQAFDTVVSAAAGFAKTFQSAFSILFGSAMAKPKSTRQQAHEKAQAAGNVETLHVEAVAAHTQEQEITFDWQEHQQKTDKQARDVEIYTRFGGILTRDIEPDQPREVQRDPYHYERERERERER